MSGSHAHQRPGLQRDDPANEQVCLHIYISIYTYIYVFIEDIKDGAEAPLLWRSEEQEEDICSTPSWVGWGDGRETKIIKEMMKYVGVDVLITQHEVR